MLLLLALALAIACTLRVQAHVRGSAERSAAASAERTAALHAELDLQRSEIARLGVQLAEEHTRSQCLIDDSHDLVCRYDLTGRLTQMSAGGLELLGYAPNPEDLRHLRDFVDARFYPLLLPIAHGGREGPQRSERGEIFAHTRRGDGLWLDVRVRKLVVAGQVIGAEAIASNVTAKKSTEQSLVTYAVAVQALAAAISLDGPVEGALQTLAEQLGFDYVELWGADAQDQALRTVAIWHMDDPALQRIAAAARQRSIARGVALVGRVWALEASLYLPDLDASPLGRGELEMDSDFHTALAFPVRLLGRVAGVLVLLTFKRPSSRNPALDLLDTLGSQIGQFAERKCAEERISRSEERHRAVLESTIDCVITTDKDGRVLEFNPAAEQTFGYTRADAVGRNVEDLIIPLALRAQHRQGLRNYLATGERHLSGRIEISALRADGTEIPIELVITPIRLRPEPMFTAFLRDISDRKELERIKDELVSTVSHELRTPLASVRGFVELLLVRDYPREEQRKFLGIIDTEIKRLTRLINDFLEVQRLEAGERKYDLAEHDMCALLRECVEVAAGSAGGHEFSLDIPDAPLQVRVDSDRMRQVVMNLISNAVKFSPAGGNVFVRAADRGDRVEVSIRDEGIGMAPDVVQKLFRKFYRADSSATRAIEGTGLGLALVREIITAHAGELRVESEPGVGSEFFFAVPLLRNERKSAAGSAASAAAQA